MRKRNFLSLLLLSCLLIGCSGRKGDVSGVVRFKGEPLPSGRITFVCEGGDKPSLSADIKDGKYSITAAPAGPAKVIVETFNFTTTPVPGQPKDVAPPGGAKPEAAGKFVRIPPRYGNTQESGLNYTIVGGAQEKNFDLEP